MADPRIDEILARLAALEARLPPATGAADHGGAPPPPPPRDDGGSLGPPGLGAGFDEKRIVDLIVSLVTQQIEQLLKRRFEEGRLNEEELSRLVSREVDQRLTESNERMREWLEGTIEHLLDPEAGGEADGTAGKKKQKSQKKRKKRDEE